jgi:circadian clock protein KaiB
MNGKKHLPQRGSWALGSTARAASPPDADTDGANVTDGDFWELRLYVAGMTPRAEAALANLTRACELHLRGHYSIALIDLLVNPRLASSDQIVALPTLVRRLPIPIKKLIGDLSNLERILVGLELKASQVPS